jgi:FtsH-binding integral membrane protein
MEEEQACGESFSSPGIFVVLGGAILTYSILTRETRKRYGMNKILATLYAVAIGLILFSLFKRFHERWDG